MLICCPRNVARWLAHLIVVSCALVVISPIAAAEPPKPNLILILLDDADGDLLRQRNLDVCFPNLRHVANQSLQLTNFHVTSPVCGPSRASLLRGQYAHRINMKTNSSDRSNPLNQGYAADYQQYAAAGYAGNDLPVWLRDAGYYTMFVGKYLHSELVYPPAPGWDEYYGSVGRNYYNTIRMTTRNGPQGTHEFLGPNYRTRVEGEDIVRLLHEYADGSSSDKPFFLYYAPFAPHSDPSGGEVVETRYQTWWPNLQLPTNSPAFDEEDISDKPAFYHALPRLSASRKETLRKHYRERVLATRTVDDVLGELMLTLAQIGRLENTYIIVTSDNGFLLGHHRSVGKQEPFDRVSRVPTWVWGPDVPAGSANHLLAHIDLAPTLLELGGAPTAEFIDGMSFAQLLRDPSSVPESQWRYSILIENWMWKRPLSHFLPTSYKRLRTYDEAYTMWATGEIDYYDLAIDPDEVENRVTQLSLTEHLVFQTAIDNLKQHPRIPLVTFSGLPLHPVHRRGPLDLSGLAEDDREVRRVRLVIRKTNTPEFWNGSSWQSQHVQVQAQLAVQGRGLVRWEYRLDPGGLANTTTHLTIAARAVDDEGQFAGEPVTRHVVLDHQPPDTLLESPSAGTTVSSPIQIAGRVVDDSQPANARLVIYDRDRDRYWTGSRWQRSHITFEVPVDSQGAFTYSIAAPRGRYRVSARGYDAVGNWDFTPAAANFTVR